MAIPRKRGRHSTNQPHSFQIRKVGAEPQVGPDQSIDAKDWACRCSPLDRIRECLPHAIAPTHSSLSARTGRSGELSCDTQFHCVFRHGDVLDFAGKTVDEPVSISTPRARFEIFVPQGPEAAHRKVWQSAEHEGQLTHGNRRGRCLKHLRSPSIEGERIHRADARKSQAWPSAFQGCVAMFIFRFSSGEQLPATTSCPQTRMVAWGSLAHAREASREKPETERP
jgi:hypothetical protein